jgi:hypothetical protein
MGMRLETMWSNVELIDDLSIINIIEMFRSELGKDRMRDSIVHFDYILNLYKFYKVLLI